MEAQQIHPGIILLTQNLTAADLTSVRAWFEDSQFDLCEAADVFQAIEQLSDFTEPSRPDVVLLEANCPDTDFALLRELSSQRERGSEPSVFAFRPDRGSNVSKELDAILQDINIIH